uniref:Uncharacterized protein n=1 Tax=Hyaloperonospora arabidopsidis (strain Emoy2) TaxID=559515 RepID=M4BDM0_HYAAE
MIGLEIAQGSELRTYVNSVFNLLSERKVFTSGSTCWSSPSPPSSPSSPYFPSPPPSLQYRRFQHRRLRRARRPYCTAVVTQEQ